MFRWLYRCGKGCLGAVVGLAALIAIAEVGLRIAAITTPLVPAQNAAPTPAAVPSFVTGWELRPLHRTTVHPDKGEPFVFRTNRWGMRGGDVAVPKSAGVFRIVCLGDANLIAPDCPEPNTFCVQLQAALQSGTNYPIEIVNAGLPLGGPGLALIHTERTVAALQPDAILLLLDAQDIVQEVALRKWMTRDRQGQPVSCAPPESPLPKSPNVVARLRNEFRLIDYGWQRLCDEMAADQVEGNAKTRRETELPRNQVARALEPLRELHQRCEARHARMLIVATPSRASTISHDEETSAALSDKAFFSAVGELLKQTGITGIDATAAFDMATPAEEDGWSVEEHRALAGLVAQGIRERLPGPWSSPYFQPGPVTPASHRIPANGSPR